MVIKASIQKSLRVRGLIGLGLPWAGSGFIQTVPSGMYDDVDNLGLPRR